MTKPRILYIEDYPVVQTIYVEVLTKAGFEVVVAKDGREATARSEGQTFDVMLVDLLLPHMSGLDFLQNYRKKHPAKDDATIIIVLTDFDDVHSVQKVKDLGIEHYWIKVENTPHMLADKINDLLAKKKD